MVRGEEAEKIWPKVPLVTLLSGLPKLTLLKSLKNSALKWRLRSVILVSFTTPKSVSKKPGPRRMLLPVLPNVPRGRSWG